MNVIGEIDLICEDFNIKIPENRTRVFDLPQYQKQTVENSDYYTHYGGDVFKTSNEVIFLSFQMKAKVRKLES